MIDFHTHILPEIDDGSRSVEESLRMLKSLRDQGVGKVIATPHFYANEESLDSFIRRRASAYETLVGNMPDGMPEVILGAEVRYYDGIGHLQELKTLRTENTRFLLLEMPFDRWTEYSVHEVTDIASRGQFTLVLAHIERYLQMQKKSVIDGLRANGVLFQVNASFFTTQFKKAKALALLKKNEIHFIGSDCHNMADRQPNISKAIGVIGKKFGESFVSDYVDYTKELFKQNQIKI